MSDLISRKALIRRLFYAKDGSKYPTRDCDNFQLTVGLEDLRKYIYEIPTAYDVDKVVEQLEKLPHRRLQLSDAMMDIMESKKTGRHFICLEDVIAIVKGAVKE